MARPFVKLRSRLLEEDICQKEIAAQINIDPSTLSKKMMGCSPFTADEMYMICDILNIDDNQLHIYFPRRENQTAHNKRIRECLSRK